MPRQNPYCRHNHIQIISCERDHAVSQVELQQESLNSIDVAHGGLLFSMGDTAAGHAARTDGRRYVTQTSTIHFIRNVGIGHTIRAEASIRHRGRATCLVGVSFTDEAGRMLAAGDYTFFCIDH